MLQVADMFMEAVDLPELHAVGEQVACGAEAERWVGADGGR